MVAQRAPRSSVAGFPQRAERAADGRLPINQARVPSRWFWPHQRGFEAVDGCDIAFHPERGPSGLKGGGKALRLALATSCCVRQRSDKVSSQRRGGESVPTTPARR